MVWGFTLMARDGWGVAPITNPPGAAERAWLCSHCERRAAVLARGLERLAAPRGERPKSKRLKVLVIDDHVLMLRSMVRMLAGCDTVVTSSPIQALTVLEGGATFDAIVCDVMMPELSGTELYLRCFRQSPELARRFVFASADPITARHMIAQTVSQTGATHVPSLLSKPTSRTLLMNAVASAAASASRESGTYFMQFPSKLWTDDGEAKGLSVATEATVANPTAVGAAKRETATRRSSSGFR